jgi:lipopolysaccharide export system permease protein
LRWRVAYRLDLYMLRVLAAPLAFVLAAVLVAQLLERLLRLFDLVATTGAPIASVFTIVAHLVPHYLGVALPAAFAVAMFFALARLSEDSELDILLSSGRSLSRVAMPYFLLSLGLAFLSLYLFAHLQPLSRYAYRAAVHQALHARWDAQVDENRFAAVGQGFVFHAEGVDADKRGLQGVFVQRAIGTTEEITTAPHGRLVPTADGRLLLELQNGATVRTYEDGQVWFGRFAKAVINANFSTGVPAFRARGGSVRELTLKELWTGMQDPPSTSLPLPRLAGEFHGRLARSFVLALLPLLAIPLGVAAKGGGRAAGAVFIAVLLVALNHSLQFGESLAESGRADAALAVWGPIALFAVFCLWFFRASLAWPGDNPITRAAARSSALLRGIDTLRRAPR